MRKSHPPLSARLRRHPGTRPGGERRGNVAPSSHRRAPARTLSFFSHVRFGLSAASHMPPTFPIHKTRHLAHISVETLFIERARHQTLPAKHIPETRKTPRIVRKYGNDVFWSAGGWKAGDALLGSGTSNWASIGPIQDQLTAFPPQGPAGNLSQSIQPVLSASHKQSS